MQQTQEQITAFYDAFYEGEGFSYYSPAVTRRALSALCSRAGVPAGGRILDVGCATGYYAAAFASLGYPVTGIDISRTAISRAKKLHPHIRFDVQDASALSFEDRSFDLVFAMGLSLANTPDLQTVQKTLRRLLRVTAAEGTLAFLGGSDLRGKAGEESNWYHHTWEEILRFPPEGVCVAGGPWLTHFRLMSMLPPPLAMGRVMTQLLRLFPLRFERRIVLLLKP